MFVALYQLYIQHVPVIIMQKQTLAQNRFIFCILLDFLNKIIKKEFPNLFSLKWSSYYLTNTRQYILIYKTFNCGPVGWGCTPNF